MAVSVSLSVAAVWKVVGSTPTTRSGSFLRFNSPPIMSSPYLATRNKGVLLLSVLRLWPIVETSVMSENDGITVRQTISHK